MTSPAPLLDIALEYIARGWFPLPVPYKQKRPKIQKWQDLRLTADTAPNFFNGARGNIGIILGCADLVDVDLDSQEAVIAAPRFLPAGTCSFGRPGKRNSHYFYCAPGLAETAGQATIQFKDPAPLDGTAAMLVELRCGGAAGAQTIVPPSVHPSGELVSWEDGIREPLTVPADVLHKAVRRIAVCSLLARHMPASGNRHTAFLAIGGLLSRGGFPEPKIWLLADAITAAGGFDREHANTARDAARAYAAGKRTFGVPHMIEIFGKPVVDTVIAWLQPAGAGNRESCEEADSAPAANGVALEDFVAYMEQHSYIYRPTRETWPAISVNARLGRVPLLDSSGAPLVDSKGAKKTLLASVWLDKHSPAEQVAWAPGEPELIRDRLIGDGTFIAHPGATCFNLYRPPVIVPGDPAKAGPWLDHGHKIFPDDVEHLNKWLAHRRQRPGEKINHGIVLGSTAQGVGKDTWLDPAKQAVGPWNFSEPTPAQVMGRFNGYVKAVIMRISEARDLGDVSRYDFYDHMKAFCAAPPDVLRCDEKNLREHSVINCVGPIITTNHKAAGLYLPAEDRRHFVAWSPCVKEDFGEAYWTRLWKWYEAEGYRHVAAYLDALDLSGFDAKAPPPKTQAFWDIVDSNRAPEDAEMADVLDALGNPDAVTLGQLKTKAKGEFFEWLCDRRNRRVILFRLEACGYGTVRNPDARDGVWKIRGERQAVYAKSSLTLSDRIVAVRRLANEK